MVKQVHGRNWALIITATIVIVLNLALLVFSSLYARAIGWWSIAIILSALSGIVLAVTAIKRNDPSLLLLDLLFSQ